ncbi:branched-chain amino acid ABC transporter permease [Deinococcus deserti]|uniref:Putative branched-chain amino acid ABC transporter, permease component n=1 Tax=Deinococcus deserti (strain DSM 17065 / CIP 109153 / LMG 22923 / VCD115) TaxID=546414 RepID=C1CW66_DEIDV|nr:branched-chain amino acid ABC transporter permease [Deinococcus deserti]ACO46433.1 putative branched-chain amino acid ABC transporter, permease component [Deinococcus deserti VCD115]
MSQIQKAADSVLADVAEKGVLGRTMTRRPDFTLFKLWPLAAFFALALIFPFLPLGDKREFLLQIGFFTLVAGIMALSWDILARSGQVSLAHAAFYGLGAYTYALLLKTGLPWLAAMPLAALLAGLFSLVLGAVTMRLSGMYFAIATLAFTEVIRTVIQNLPESVAGGANGMLVPALLGGNSRGQYLLALSLLLLTVGVSLAVRLTRLHHAFAAIRQGEETARVLGVSIVRYKLAAFFISSVLAALAGVLYAGKTFFINPLETFSLANSIAPLTTSIFGGLYTTLGPVLGATVLRVAEEILHNNVKNGYLVVYGLVLMLSILWLPRGLMGLLRRGKHGGDL